MGMRISYNARAGDKYHRPRSGELRALARPKSNFEVEFMLACDRVGVSREHFASLSRASLLSLCRETMLSKGLSEAQVGALLARIDKENAGCETDAATMRVRDLLLEMLRRDDALRLSEDVQARYALQPDSWNWKWKVTDDVQKQVCKEFGFGSSMAEGLDLLRSSMSLYPHDDEVRHAAHYLRYNHHMPCPSSLVSSVMPNIKLHDMRGDATSLDAILSAGKATVVIAGSHT